MKIVVMSDSHRLFSSIQRIIEAQPDADMYIHLGDAEGKNSSASAATVTQTSVFRQTLSFPLTKSTVFSQLTVTDTAYTTPQRNSWRQLKRTAATLRATVTLTRQTTRIQTECTFLIRAAAHVPVTACSEHMPSSRPATTVFS